MKLYQPKQLNIGFIILCPEHTVKLLQQTFNSITGRYPNKPVICVTDQSATAADLKEMRAVCPTYKGRATYSSLINLGFKETKADWNFVVCAGTTMRNRLDQRFSFFLESEKDILYPIADNKYNFVDGTINGLFMNRKTYLEIGDMAETCPWEICKTLWAICAVEYGCKFKAVSNSKIC